MITSRAGGGEGFALGFGRDDQQFLLNRDQRATYICPQRGQTLGAERLCPIVRMIDVAFGMDGDNGIGAIIQFLAVGSL